MKKASVDFKNITKEYSGNVTAVDNISCTFEPGSLTTLLGPSGCGKTTSLRLIAGLERATSGNVFIDNEDVTLLPATDRDVSMVFQSYALFPHMTVDQNIGYGLRQRRPKPAKSDIHKQVDEILEVVRMSGYGKRRVWELSGGQQQRVALARALINRPTVLLLDEPLAALDRKLRREMQIELQTLQRDVGITFILVTHDQEEALSMSDRICIMRDGQVVQTGSPRQLYDQPTNLYVADFVGKSNFIAGAVTDVNGRSVTIKDKNGQTFIGSPSQSATGLSVGASASIVIRPEMVVLSKHDTNAKDMSTDVAMNGRIKNRIFLGEHTEYLVDAEGLGDILVLSPKHIESAQGGFEPGDAIVIGWKNVSALALEDS